MTETDAQLARRLLGDVLNGELKWTPDMRLRIATVAQALASLSIVEELRRLNEGRDQWYREVLEVLTQAKNGDGSPVGSGQPAAAPAPTKERGYYAEDWDDQCTARGHKDRRAWHRCLRPAGHDGLHEDGMGNAFAADVPAAAPDGQEGGASK